VTVTGRTKPALTLLATLAFVLAPQVTPNFTGYDPAIFPVIVERPSIQPAGYAFAIWGVIFTWLLASTAWGLLRPMAAWNAPRWPYIASVLMGAAWLAIAPHAPITATILIATMAACTFAAFLNSSPSESRWWVQAPIGLYAGWLTAATGVSLGVVLAGHGILSDTTSALTMLTLILLTAIMLQTRRPTMPSYSTAVIWAALGIAQVNWQPNPTIAYAALAGAAIQTALALWLTTRRS